MYCSSRVPRIPKNTIIRTNTNTYTNTQLNPRLVRHYSDSTSSSGRIPAALKVVGPHFVYKYSSTNGVGGGRRELPQRTYHTQTNYHQEWDETEYHALALQRNILLMDLIKNELIIHLRDHGKKTKLVVSSYFHSNFSPILASAGGSSPSRHIF